MKRYILLLFVFFSITQIFSQTSRKFSFEPIKQNKIEIEIELSSEEIHAPDGVKGKHIFLDSLKEINLKKYPRTESIGNFKKSASSEILQGISIDANSGGTPNDNSFAISNEGIAISAINSSLWYYDALTGNLLQTKSLKSLTGSSKASAYDPKLIYDPIKDRFIAVFLRDYSSSSSKIYVCFSISNNPVDGWNVYEIGGNPNGTDEWSDYPAISITDDELFITINLLQDASSWQTGFRETIVWQMNKDEGYNNQTLNPLLWQDIKENGLQIRNLHPIRNYNHHIADTPSNDFPISNQYFLSNRNFAIESDSIYLVEITNTIGNSPAMNVTLLHSADKYYLSPNGRQFNGNELATNDSRVLGGIINRTTGNIQFVQHSMDISNGSAGIYHGFIENIWTTPSCRGNIISDPDLDFGYPNIASTSRNLNDDEAIIGFNYTSSSSSFFPGTCAIYYDLTQSYSNILFLSYGDGAISASNRWGDYSGIQRKYNHPESIWFSGTFSKLNSASNITRGTWVSQILTPNFVSTYEIKPKNFSLFPNPTSDRVKIEFNSEKAFTVNINIINSEGKLVQDLSNYQLSNGVNLIEIDISSLSKGNYIITIIDSKTYSTLLNKSVLRR